LSDLGADVIRVNAFHDDYVIGHQFIGSARGKRSIALNLKDPRGRAVIHQLVRQADVVHLNIRRPATVRLGVDYETLRAINPRLVYCHTTGYERGERSDLPSNEVVGSAESGVSWADGGCDDGGNPLWSPNCLGDFGNGYLSALGVMLALYERERTGQGQSVHTSVVYACLFNGSYNYLDADGALGDPSRVDGEQKGVSALYRLYLTATDWLCLAVVSDRQWLDLCAVLGREDLCADPRFATAVGRTEHDGALAHELAECFRSRTADEWLLRLDAAGVPAEVSDPTWPLRMFDDAELIERGWVVSHDHPILGRFDQHGVMWDFSATPARVAGRPPVVGEHTIDILLEAGLSQGEIEELVVEDVVRQWNGEDSP
jgi:crotonobetainyl-CoA:carnitine CoA-transferase CaiB-like acyl-CoA transferase